MNKKKLSYGLYDQTERPGQKLPLDAHRIIKQRYILSEKLAGNKNVLEVGAGHGIGINFLSKVANSYIAAEFSNENIKIIKKRDVVSAKVIQMDAHHIPFRSKSFDLIVALAMIYYLNIDIFIRETKRILRPDGTLFFCTSNKDIAGFVPAPYTTNYYSIPELNNILDKYGFESKFYGGFVSPGKIGFYRKSRAYVRDIVKCFLFKLPWGMRYWEGMRNRYLGGLEELPWDVEEIKTDEIEVDVLDKNIINRTHRIIYCAAKLKS